MLAGWWYSTRFAYWPALLIRIALFTGLEGTVLVDCQGTTPAGTVRFIPSWEAAFVIMKRWEALRFDLNPFSTETVTRSLPQMVHLYRTEGASTAQAALGYGAPFPLLTPLFLFNLWLTVEMEMEG